MPTMIVQFAETRPLPQVEEMIQAGNVVGQVTSVNRQQRSVTVTYEEIPSMTSSPMTTSVAGSDSDESRRGDSPPQNGDDSVSDETSIRSRMWLDHTVREPSPLTLAYVQDAIAQVRQNFARLAEEELTTRLLYGGGAQPSTLSPMPSSFWRSEPGKKPEEEMKPTHKIRLVTEESLIADGYKYSREYLTHPSRTWLYKKHLFLLGGEHEAMKRDVFMGSEYYRVKTGPSAADYHDFNGRFIVSVDPLTAPGAARTAQVSEYERPVEVVEAEVVEDAAPAPNRRMRRIMEAANRSGRTLSLDALMREAFAERPEPPVQRAHRFPY